MKHSIKKGFSFGLTSGIITTLGLLVGLYSGTGSRTVVIGGILTIAIADSLSDALGIHISEESEAKHSQKQIWQATIATVISKLFFALTFLIPFFLFSLTTGVYVSVVYGLVLIGGFSYYIGKKKAAIEHLILTIIVIITTHYAGQLIGTII